MNDAYEKELSELKSKMKKAESYAKKLPTFKNIILERKIAADDRAVYLGSSYKTMPLDWEIRRFYYCSKSRANMTNNSNEYQGYFFNIYINSLSMFNVHDNFDLFQSISKSNYFYYDKCNTTFYVSDDDIECFLEELLKWYKSAKKQVVEFNKNKRKAELIKELDQINKGA